MSLLKKITFWFIFINANVFATEDDDIKACMDVFDLDSMIDPCCENLKAIEKLALAMDDCFPKKPEDFACENIECVFKKKKVMDGNMIDNNAAKKLLQDLIKEFPKEKASIERVSRECLDGKYMEYEVDNACPAMNFIVCLHLNSHLECESWKKTDACIKMSENTKKCKAAMDAAQ